MSVEAPVGIARRRVAQREHFGVRGRIVGELTFVVPAREDPTVVQLHDHSTDRYVAVHHHAEVDGLAEALRALLARALPEAR